MTKSRDEKKTEMIEVRLPHSKKEAFKRACEEEGITVSHAVRTFVDAYLRRSRRMKAKRIAKDLSMTLIQNPIKTTTGVGGALAGAVALISLTAPASFADRDTLPIEPPTPEYPIDLAAEGISARCDNYFDVSPEGFVINLDVKCGHPGFVESSRNAVSTLRFEPKIENGEAVTRLGVVYPLEYLVMDVDGNTVPPLEPLPREEAN
ncbi:MAG: energy transducer TonB [Pseudomonadota bacterium]